VPAGILYPRAYWHSPEFFDKINLCYATLAAPLNWMENFHMSLTEVTRTLFQYHVSLNRRVWQSVLALSAEQFLAPIDYAHGSIRNQIVHMAAVDGRWLRGLQGHPNARAFNPPPKDYPTPESVFALWDPIESEFLAHVLSMDDAALQSSPPGLDEPAWQVLLHVVNHGTDHRAQLLRALHDFGAPTFPQDLIIYLWETHGQ
jgi:uncharacterized damage-inducible protein DinB